MVINFPNITLYFFKRATPLRLTKRTFSQWSSYIIIYSEMFCILPKDWKPHVRKCCGCALNLTLCSKFFKKWIVKFVMSRQAPKPPKTSKPPKPPNHRGCGGVDSCFHIATHVKSLRMSSSWLWWKCVRAPAKVFTSLSSFFFFCLARAETEMCNSSFAPSWGDGWRSLIPGCQLEFRPGRVR